ncbi:uncharacterized protein FIBRA_00517 [Fibroporia radiculosa]|uniref:Secreted protein n=1 Tax=Fibroporia radiculosa TaxID=599839 RepID=J4G0C7_9APHY|nr:uncharacterized protein FIBRA_00517 [Fibroporia radiculosa]CCL98518.1 predicted protein [Fibroporia radiculosa]
MLHRTLWLSVLSLSAFHVLSSPVASSRFEQGQVAITAQPSRKYENGELPPEENTPGWADPRLRGGRLLDVRPPVLLILPSYPSLLFPLQFTIGHLGEPLNVIISGLSDPFVLTEAGLHAYAKSIGYSEECLGLHYGNIHAADLGDGLGRKPEQYLARQYYFPVMGTCWESVRGGHHFRAWKQNGTEADSGAWFIGASLEKDSSKHHQISRDGYNRGRDFLVEQATAGSYRNSMWWQADVEWREGLLEKGNRNVNHDIEQDGRVAILTVRRL